MRVFKYFPPARSGFLADRLIRFTQPGDFNDPFELRTPLESLIGDSELKQVARDEIEKQLLAAYAIQFGSKRTPTREEKAKIKWMTQELAAKIEPAMSAAHGHALDVINADLFPTGADKALGILCLASCPTNLLMWAHYTDNYRGFVVEFDTQTPFFENLGGVHKDVGQLTAVTYANSRPSIGPDSKTDPTVAFLFTKAKQWEYEQEWRLVRPLRAATKVIPVDPFPTHLFEIPARSITSVIVGHRMAKVDFEKLHDALRSPLLEHVALQRIQMADRDYAVTVESATCWQDLRADENKAASAKASFAALLA